MKTKTKIERQLERKTNPQLVKTIIDAKKNEKWQEVASIISSPRRQRINLNIEQIDKESKEGDILLIPGKVLSQGEMNKKIKIIALEFSEKAKEKLLKSKCEVSYVIDEIKKNPEAKGIKILRK